VNAADREVIRAVRRGDREAFGLLVQRYQGRLFGLAFMIVRDQAGAEDVTQDAFVRAYTRLDHYDDRRPFYPWLATIAVRLSQNRLRSRVARREDPPPDTTEPGVRPVALDLLMDDERGRALWRAVAALPSGERTAVMLYYRDELSIGDAARVLGVTSGTVKTLLFRARRHLREHFEQTAIDPGEIRR
jgi:RNA polymerase sigma-70 factor (ECF subfamily)